MTSTLIMLLGTYLLMMVYNLVNCNLQNGLDRLLVTRAMVALRGCEVGAPADSLARLQRGVGALEVVRSYLEVQNELRPLTLLGIPATPRMLGTAGAVVALVAPLVSSQLAAIVSVHFGLSTSLNAAEHAAL